MKMKRQEAALEEKVPKRTKKSIHITAIDKQIEKDSPRPYNLNKPTYSGKYKENVEKVHKIVDLSVSTSCVDKAKAKNIKMEPISERNRNDEESSERLIIPHHYESDYQATYEHKPAEM